MTAKFKRPHATYVLVVRHPDDANRYTIDGDVHTIDIDLGSAFDGKPDSADDAVEFANNLPHWLNVVPINSPVYREVLDTVASAVEDYDAAVAVVSAYRARREG